MKRSSGKPSLTLLRDTAIEAAHSGGRVLVKHFGKKLKISEKKDAGLVTNADLEAEAAVVKKLTAGTPDFGFVTEEAPPVEKALARPLDRGSVGWDDEFRSSLSHVLRVDCRRMGRPSRRRRDLSPDSCARPTWRYAERALSSTASACAFRRPREWKIRF